MELRKCAKRAARGAVLCLIFAFSILYCGVAAEGTETEDTSEQIETMTEIALSESEDVVEPNTAKPAVSAEYHKDFVYSSDIVMSGIFETNTYYFEIPEYWTLEYAYAEFQLSLSRLIQGDVPASLTFMVNGEPITSYEMDYANGREQTIYVEIPTDMLQEGYNSLSITGYVRIYDDEGCLDDVSGANWVSISEDSYIQCGYDIAPSEGLISWYPYPYISTVNESGAGLYVAVSDAVDADELAAALYLRADLGDETDMEDEISLVKASDIPESAEALVIVSLMENLDEEYRSEVEALTDGGDLSDRAMIATMTSEGGAPVLLITSENGECLYEAAALLLDEDRVTQERTRVCYVSLSSAEMAKNSGNDSADSASYTLDELMGGGLTLVGPFHQETEITLPFSGGYVLSGSGKIELQFRYSENLDFDRSLITVYWGDVPIASKKLTAENAGGDTLSFTMPEDVVGTYASSITIAFELELPELYCTTRLDDMPWAYVTGDSSFYLPVGEGSTYSFSSRPYPFEISSEFNELMVVIPDEISAAELETLGQVIAKYGVSLSPYGSLTVVKSSEALAADKGDYNIIAVGTRTDNALIDELNEYLGFTYSDAGDKFSSNELLILSDSYAGDIGTLQLFESPYGEGRAVLAVAALNDATMEYIGSFLSEVENVWALTGDTALIDAEGEVRCYQVAEDASSEAEPVLRTIFTENRETAIFVVVSVGVMLLFLLAAVLILLRSYLRGKGK